MELCDKGKEEEQCQEGNYTHCKQVDEIFQKNFVIKDGERYSLPEPHAMFKEDPWRVDKLQSLKNELNGVKNLLNNYDLHKWQAHTNLRNSARDVMIRVRRDIQPEFMTQAWCKFYEIASSFPLVPIDRIVTSGKRFKSVHLCEAPGAFVASLNHWLKTNAPFIQWDWIATTLNPYYEGNSLSIMINDDRFMRYTLSHWYFGEDNTGNLMNLRNLDELVRLSEPRNEVLLVTADGSIDCVDVPGEQENVVSHLHFCETVAALHILTTGGSFLLKLFTIFEYHTICLVYLLSCCFDKINIVKPVTSKEGNSETYVVCTNFKGADSVAPYLSALRNYYEDGCTRAMFHRDDIPSAFLDRIIECSEFFKNQQCLVIMRNIYAFELENKVATMSDTKQLQRMIADRYIKDYNLKKLTSGEIVGKTVLDRSNNINTSKKVLLGSYNDRCERQHLNPWVRLRQLFNDFHDIQINTPSDKVIKFKPSKLPEDLWIRSGKAFEKIKSSRFCDAYVLEIQNTADSILRELERETDFPGFEKITELHEQFAEPKYTVLAFRYTDPYDSHKLFARLHDKLESLENGQTLILIGYSLLTHFNVGLLHLASCLFNSLEIRFCDHAGLLIILREYKYDVKILKYLIDIKTASLNEQQRGKAILTILPASFLYESDLFSTIMDGNHWVTKLYIHTLAHTLEKDTTNTDRST